MSNGALIAVGMWPADRIDRLDLAAVARRGAGIEEGHAPEPVLKLLPLDDAMPRRLEGQRRGPRGRFGDVRRERVAGLGPGLDPAVEHADPLAVDPAPPEPEVVEHPPQARRDPAADVVVADDAPRRRRCRPRPCDPGRPRGRGAGGDPGAP